MVQMCDECRQRGRLRVGVNGCSLTAALLFAEIHTDHMIKCSFKGCVVAFIPSSFTLGQNLVHLRKSSSAAR